jgi:hypothetical protein
MKLDAEQVRSGLNLIADLGAWVAKFTPTSKDDQAFEFLKLIANTPGAIEKVLEIVQKKSE